MVKLVWRLSDNLCYHVFSIKTRNKLDDFYELWRQLNVSSACMWSDLNDARHTYLVQQKYIGVIFQEDLYNLNMARSCCIVKWSLAFL